MRQRLAQLAEQYEDYREIYEHMDEYPIKLLAALCNNEEMLDFVKGYLDSDGSVTGGFSLLELAEEHPVILQWDKRWGYASLRGQRYRHGGLCAHLSLNGHSSTDEGQQCDAG